MASIASSMQALSLEQVPPESLTPPQDSNSPTESQPHTPPNEPSPSPSSTGKPRRKSRPDQVDPRPLPSMDEWLDVQAAGGCMYYGFYADDEGLQNMLATAFPKQLGHRDLSGCTFLYPALLFLRKHFRRRDLCVASATLPQRAKDLNPEIRHEVGETVLILGVFQLEEEAYLDRMTQDEVDELAYLMGKKPTWWQIVQLMPSI